MIVSLPAVNHEHGPLTFRLFFRGKGISGRPEQRNDSGVQHLKGEEGLQFGIDLVAARTAIKRKSLPQLLSSTGIEGLVLDSYDFYGEIIPMRLGLPYAIVSNALHFDYSGYTPLCIYDWAHEKTPEAIARNRQGVSKLTERLISQQRRSN